MAYTTQNDLLGLIPQPFMVQALDDNKDGLADDGAWDSVAAEAARKVDAILGRAYRVPFAAPYPDLVVEASNVFAAERLYRRGGFADSVNPWKDEAARLSEALNKAADERSLGEAYASRVLGPTPALISEDARTTSDSGRMLS